MDAIHPTSKLVVFYGMSLINYSLLRHARVIRTWSGFRKRLSLHNFTISHYRLP